MDRQTVYIGELPQVSDFLKAQRHALRALAALTTNLFGRSQLAATLDPASGPNALATAGTHLRVVVPPLALYELAAVDPSGWSTLTADATQLLLQGLSLGAVTLPLNGAPDTALSIGAANIQIFLIQAKLSNAVDEVTSVLPYFPLIQMVTVAGSTTSVLKVNSNQGVSAGDRILVQGVASTDGKPCVVLSTTSTDTITLDTGVNQLTGSPGTGVTVRDVNPNNGVPLSGQANDGVAQATQRDCKITLSVKAGTPSHSPTVPSPDAGFIPLYVCAGIDGSNAIFGSINFAPNAPFFPSLVGTSHHKGIAGHANKIDFQTEVGFPAVAGGMLSLFAAPTANLHAATKQYVDAQTHVQDKVANGFIYFQDPAGSGSIVVEWGTATSDGLGVANVTLPVAMLAAPFVVLGTVLSVSPETVTIPSQTSTGFVAHVSATVSGNPIAATFAWIAVGKV